MHAFTLSLLLLPAALAHRHRYGPGDHHNLHHHPLSSGAVTSGAPQPSTASNAPYGLGNTTSIFGSTGLVTAISTLSSATATESSEPGEIDSSAAAQVGHAGSPGGSSVNAVDSTSCDSDAVTVTENPIVTVTVTPGEGSISEPTPSSSVTLAVSSGSSVTSVFTGISESSITPSSSESSVTSVFTGISESLITPSSSSSNAPVTETSTPEVSSVPTSTSEVNSTSAVQTTVASSSETSSPSPSTVTVIPIPATTPATSEVETTTPQSSAPVQTKKQLSATVVASSTAPESTGGSGSTSSPGGCPGKRGIIATAGGKTHDQGNISLAYANEPNICWIANWYSAPPPYWNKDKQFIPQYYGVSSSATEWKENAGHAFNNSEKIFLSFGEPYAKGPDHQEAAGAVDKYMELMQPWADQGVKICSPGLLQPKPDIDWLADFLNRCEKRGCTINMICIHWYDTTSAANPGFPEFKQTVEKAIELGKGKKVWVDNFQANGTPEDVKAFLDVALPYLEGNDAVERYAYVPPLRTDPNKHGAGYRTDQFIDPDLSSNGTLTALGKYYADFKLGA